ncbi:MAG: beta-glucosidase [Gemmatimonadales bacterium]|nr:beta-glucosidase [Gemmatimonadales bacterium]
MTLEEKFWQLYMVPGDFDAEQSKFTHSLFGLQLRGAPIKEQDPAAAARINAERINRAQRHFTEGTRLGIPAIPFEEALHGLVQEGATVFPQAIGLAASWDTALMGRVAQTIARESGSRGVRQVLSPVINIARDVRWGRTEETYGEDPYLTSSMGLAFIEPFERAGIVTTPKHFAANVGDGGRDSYPIHFSERLLEEIYFPAFRTAIGRGKARSVMAAYNSVDGLPASASPWLLTTKLRREWGFGGVVISDAAGTGGSKVLHYTSKDYAEATKQAIEAGLDVIFQSSVGQAPLFWEAFRNGAVDPAATDSAVARVLRLKFELGLFERPYVDPEAAGRISADPAHRDLALEAARKSIVLLKNERRLLPLSKSLRRVAVIGADAEEGRLGGYTGPVGRKISILDGIRTLLGPATTVRYAKGPGRLEPAYRPVPSTALSTVTDGKKVPGLRGEYFDNITLAGDPKVVRIDPALDFTWTFGAPARGIPVDWYSVRWTGKLIAPVTGMLRLGVLGNDGYRLYLDGKLVIDNWRRQTTRATLAPVSVRAGREYDIRLEYFESAGNVHFTLVWDHGVPKDGRARIVEAVALARASEVAIVVAGIEEGEFRDRSSLKLPGLQEELIRAVAATGTSVAVVLVGGSAITMNGWLDRVGAVLDVWYPGQEGGRAVAETLFGDSNPGGRLPISFPLNEGQLPLYYNHKPTGRGDDYLDGTGKPLFPFGFGLSYTTFEYSDLAISSEPSIGSDALRHIVRFRLGNTGARAGDEVVQLYLRDLIGSVARPVQELRRFRRVHLAAGQSTTVEFALTGEDLALLDARMRRIVEPGEFRVTIGASSQDIRLRGTITIQ